MAHGMRSSVKSKYETYKKILEKKAAEVQESMSAQKAAQVLAREEHPHDEGDLSQQSHDEWIFLNRNTLDIKLLRDTHRAPRDPDRALSFRGVALEHGRDRAWLWGSGSARDAQQPLL